MTRRRCATALAVAVVVGALAVACGIPVDHAARVIDRRDEPAQLAGTSTTVSGKGDQVGVHLFLIRNASSNPQIAPVSVTVSNQSSTVGMAQEALQRLISYLPTASSQLSNAIPATLRVLSAKLDGDVLAVNLSSLNVESSTVRLAFAELVFTATDLTGVDAVRFSINGNGAQVPLDRSTSPAGAAIERSDYRQLGQG